jgi:hypothetical protein
MCVCYFFIFLCRFVEDMGGKITIEKPELDFACRDKKHKIFTKDFCVSLCFDSVDYVEVAGNELAAEVEDVEEKVYLREDKDWDGWTRTLRRQSKKLKPEVLALYAEDESATVLVDTGTIVHS